MSASTLYLRVREKEGRIYPDEIAAHLPEVPPDHPLRDEWRVRARSMERLSAYTARLPRPCRVLELGCGNGWLSHRLAAVPGVQVWGLDRASTELSQAARVFAASNLAFLTADIFQPPFVPASFNIIVVASVIQYFPDLRPLIRGLRKLLAKRGEVHIIDSPLYEEQDLAAARERTEAYYAGLGFAQMAEQYFHHTPGELDEFSPRWLYRPGSIEARISRALGQGGLPFPWISIGA